MGEMGNRDTARVRRLSWYIERSWTPECMDSDAISASLKRPAKRHDVSPASFGSMIETMGLTWNDVRQAAQRALNLRHLTGILGDELFVHAEPLRRKREYLAQTWARR